MKKFVLCFVAFMMATLVSAEQIQTLTVKVKNATKVAFTWFSTNPNTTQFKVEILNSENVLVASLTCDKDYWNYWFAFYDDYTPVENEHYASTQYILRHSLVTKGEAWNGSTVSLGGYEYGLVEGTYYIVVTGLGSNNSVTEEAATLEVVIKQIQEQEDEDGNIMLNVIGMEAAYITQSDFSDIDHPWWLLLFYTGQDETSDGYPIVWITIDSGREDAISGEYSLQKGNVYININGDNNCFVDRTGNYADYLFAKDVDLKLDFSGFYQPYVQSDGYYLGTYTGSFKIETESGKTYVANFNNQLCSSFTYATINNANKDKDFILMLGEDTHTGLENISNSPSKPVKVLENGNVYILRQGKRFTITGNEVR